MRDDIRAARREIALKKIAESAPKLASTKAQKEKAEGIEPPANVRDSGAREVYRLEGIAAFMESLTEGSSGSSKKGSQKGSGSKDEEG